MNKLQNAHMIDAWMPADTTSLPSSVQQEHGGIGLKENSRRNSLPNSLTPKQQDVGMRRRWTMELEKKDNHEANPTGVNLKDKSAVEKRLAELKSKKKSETWRSIDEDVLRSLNYRKNVQPLNPEEELKCKELQEKESKASLTEEESNKLGTLEARKNAKPLTPDEEKSRNRLQARKDETALSTEEEAELQIMMQAKFQIDSKEGQKKGENKEATSDFGINEEQMASCFSEVETADLQDTLDESEAQEKFKSQFSAADQQLVSALLSGNMSNLSMPPDKLKSSLQRMSQECDKKLASLNNIISRTDPQREKKLAEIKATRQLQGLYREVGSQALKELERLPESTIPAAMQEAPKPQVRPHPLHQKLASQLPNRPSSSQAPVQTPQATVQYQQPSVPSQPTYRPASYQPTLTQYQSPRPTLQSYVNPSNPNSYAYSKPYSSLWTRLQQKFQNRLGRYSQLASLYQKPYRYSYNPQFQHCVSSYPNTRYTNHMLRYGASFLRQIAYRL